MIAVMERAIDYALPGPRRRGYIRQLADVLQCKLHHHLQDTGTADEDPP